MSDTMHCKEVTEIKLLFAYQIDCTTGIPENCSS